MLICGGYITAIDTGGSLGIGWCNFTDSYPHKDRKARWAHRKGSSLPLSQETSLSLWRMSSEVKERNPIETDVPQIHRQCLKLALPVFGSGEISFGCPLCSRTFSHADSLSPPHFHPHLVLSTIHQLPRLALSHQESSLLPPPPVHKTENYGSSL